MRGCLLGCGCLTLVAVTVFALTVVGIAALVYPYFRAARELPAGGCPRQAPAEAPPGRAVCPARVAGLEFTGGRSYRVRFGRPGEPTGMFQKDRDLALALGYSYRSTVSATLQASLAAAQGGRVAPVRSLGTVTLKAAEGIHFEVRSLPESAGRYAFLMRASSGSAVIFLLPFEVR